jgi:hypothetical protein
MNVFLLAYVAMHLVTVGEKLTLHAAKIRKDFCCNSIGTCSTFVLEGHK